MIPDLDTDGNLPPGIHHATPFLEFFQRDRITKQPKGIIAIDLTGLP